MILNKKRVSICELLPISLINSRKQLRKNKHANKIELPNNVSFIIPLVHAPFSWKATAEKRGILRRQASIPAIRSSIRWAPIFQSSQVLPPELGNNSLQPSRRPQTKGIVIYDNFGSIFDATAPTGAGNKWNPRAKFISGAHYFRKYAAFRR